MYANNEIGTIQPLRDIAKVIKLKKENRKLQGNTLPLYFHTDACQAANYLPLLVNNLGVDLMTLNGGKIYGPKQSGVLFVRSGITLQPQILGGGQERNIRSGTENVAGNIGFATALQETAKMKEEESKRLKELQDYCIKQLRATLPNAIINGSMSHRLPNNIHLTIQGRDNERLLMELDERGVMVATGSACSASSDEPSHVLTALGMSDEDARCSIRITFGRQTNLQAVDKLVENLVFVVKHTV
jgi:cysteine desulfurase